MNSQSEFVLALKDSFYSVFENVLVYAPNVIVALVLFIVGWFLAAWIGKVVSALIGSLKLDDALGATGLRELASRAGFGLNIGHVLGVFVKWMLIIIVATVAFDMVGLSQINESLSQILSYIPNIIVAAVVLMITALVAEFVEKVSTGSAKAAGVKKAGIFGVVARWFVWIVGITTALAQLQVADVLVSLFQSLLTGVVAAVAIALGVSFGLGGKEAAARYISRVEKDIE
jgi:hypothetical protein